MNKYVKTVLLFAVEMTALYLVVTLLDYYVLQLHSIKMNLLEALVVTVVLTFIQYRHDKKKATTE